MYRILKGLTYLEGLDIIHRDLKPENIVFRDKEDPYDVVIVDFGFATKVEEPAVDVDVVYGPGYGRTLAYWQEQPY